jgi:Ribbon-helix-helix domain
VPAQGRIARTRRRVAREPGANPRQIPAGFEADLRAAVLRPFESLTEAPSNSRAVPTNLFFARARISFDKVCMSVYIAVVKRTNLHLKDDQLKRLRALSDKTGAPVAELVRRAIEAYLKQHRA